MPPTIAVPFNCYMDIYKSTATTTGKRIVEGFASIADFPDLQQDVITQEALQHSAKDLIGTTLLFNHDDQRPIGHVIESEARSQGLYIKAEISQTEEELWNKVTDGTLSKFSIRGLIQDAFIRFVQDFGGEVRFIRRMRLVEASLVSVPAQPRAEVVRWYLEKALDAFCKSGGVLPKEGKGGDNSSMSMTLEQELALLDKAIEKTDSEETKSYLKSLRDEKATKKSSDGAEEEKERKRKMEEAESRVKSLEAELAKVKKDSSDSESKLKSLEAQLAQAVSERESLKSSGEKTISDLEKKVKELESQIAEQKATAEVEKQWSALVGKSYRAEDADTIKPILKKVAMGQPLTLQETESLISKKVGDSGIRVSNVGSGGPTTLSAEQQAALVSQHGIRPRVNSPFATKRN